MSLTTPLPQEGWARFNCTECHADYSMKEIVFKDGKKEELCDACLMKKNTAMIKCFFN